MDYFKEIKKFIDQFIEYHKKRTHYRLILIKTSKTFMIFLSEFENNLRKIFLILIKTQTKKLPDRRKGYTQKASINNHKVYLRTGDIWMVVLEKSSLICIKKKHLGV